MDYKKGVEYTEVGMKDGEKHVVMLQLFGCHYHIN